MTEAELKRMERELGLTLPSPYVKIMLKFPDKLRQWPASEEVDRSQFFFTDLSSILDVNHRIRKQPGDFVKSPKGFVKQWPSELLVFGQCDGNWHVIDTRLKNPPMASIKGGQFDVAGAGDLKLYLDLLGMTHRDAWKEWKEQQAAAKSAKSPPSLSRMSDAEFDQLEHKLGVKLPAAYKKVIRDFPDESSLAKAGGRQRNERQQILFDERSSDEQTSKILRRDFRRTDLSWRQRRKFLAVDCRKSNPSFV
jgi:hypothetical protein